MRSLKCLKIILIGFTILVIAYSASFFLESTEFVRSLVSFEFLFRFQETTVIIQLLIQALFISKVWKNDIPTKRSKWENTLMVFFLGVIGMWFLMVEWQKAVSNKMP